MQLTLNGRRTTAGSLSAIVLLIVSGPRLAFGQEESSEDLAKKLQNPVASLISFPLQNNFDFGIGPSEDGWRYTLNIQPVIPISIGSNWNLIVRTIIPVIHQEDIFKGPAIPLEEEIDGVPVNVSRGPRPPGHVQDGLGDIVQSFFFLRKSLSPAGFLPAGPFSFTAVRPILCWEARNGVLDPPA